MKKKATKTKKTKKTKKEKTLVKGLLMWKKIARLAGNCLGK